MKIATRIACLILSLAASAVVADRVKVPSISIDLNAKFETAVTSAELQKVGAGFTSQSPKDAALNFARTKLGVKDGGYTVKNSYSTASNGVTHVYLKQVINGIEVSNGDIAVHVDAKGQVIAYNDRFFSSGNQTSFAPKTQLWNGQQSSQFVRPRDALKVFADYIKKPIDASKLTETNAAGVAGAAPKFTIKGVPFAVKDVTAQQSYLHTQEGTVVPAWEYKIKMAGNYFHVHISADGKKILSLVDWTSDASYNVIKIGGNNPVKTPRVKVVDPADSQASSHGWHDDGKTKTQTTTGNNVDASVQGSHPKATGDLVFDYPLDLTKSPSSYQNAAVTNLFYINNVLHDVFYHYGFDEPAGNFQASNWGKGGQENDYVLAYAQDDSGTDNAYFQSPPDGENGEMHMFLWDLTNPERDGDLENDIITHEFGHGVSTRLTGGPSNSDCLDSGEAGGMGEGWSDFFALWFEQKASNTNKDTFALGEYVYTKGIRTYKYSTSTTVNPTTYAYLNQSKWKEVHAIGEIWANILYQYYWNLVDAIGYTDDKFTPNISKGNTLALKLVVDGLKLQPCNPTFVDARDAILQAEKQATNGKFACAIWKAFAKRGVGFGAKSTRGKVTESTKLPSTCS